MAATWVMFTRHRWKQFRCQPTSSWGLRSRSNAPPRKSASWTSAMRTRTRLRSSTRTRLCPWHLLNSCWNKLSSLEAIKQLLLHSKHKTYHKTHRVLQDSIWLSKKLHRINTKNYWSKVLKKIKILGATTAQIPRSPLARCITWNVRLTWTILIRVHSRGSKWSRCLTTDQKVWSKWALSCQSKVCSITIKTQLMILYPRCMQIRHRASSKITFLQMLSQQVWKKQTNKIFQWCWIRRQKFLLILLNL